MKAGKVRALAVLAGRRSPLMPDVPSLAEAGFPGIEGVPFMNMMAPAGTPRAIVLALNKVVSDGMHSPKMAERLAADGAVVRPLDEAALRATGTVPAQGNVKILTSCPSCLQGLSRYGNDLQNGLLEADYIVIEMARQLLGADWMPQYVQAANQGGIERVLV